MNAKLPNSIEELLFGELLKSVKNNHTSMSEPIDTYRFLPPLSNPSKIICLGYNYLDHAKEQGTTPPDEPIVFMKPRTALIGTGDNIVCPKFVTQLDYEGELAFVIGNKCKNVKPEEAMKYVDKERIILHPDCGFAPSVQNPIDWDEAYLKLVAMCQGAQILRSRYE